MENKNDILVDENCDCADELLELSIDDGEEAIDDLWDELEDEELEVCDSKKCNKKKWILAAIAVCAIIAVVAIIVCKKSGKSKED